MSEPEIHLDERVAKLETTVAAVVEGMRALTSEIRGLTRTNWGTWIQLAGVVLIVGGATWTLYTRDQARHDESIKALQASQDRTAEAFAKSLERLEIREDILRRDLDANLQREQRQLDAVIEQRVQGLAEIRQVTSKGLEERILALEGRLNTGFNERWSKADHVQFAQEIVHRIERLEAFHMRGP